MKEHYDFCLNDKFNAWYKAQYEAFIALNPDIKEHPEKWDNFKFDLNQAKSDAVCITDDILATCNCPSRLQTNADIHCIGRTTVYDLQKNKGQ